MPTFKIQIGRNYLIRERASIDIEARTANGALDKLKSIIAKDDGAYEEEFGEYDSCVEDGSYSWTVFGPDGRPLLAETMPVPN